MYDLSIIIPHYNTPGYLKELLQTIPVQDNIQVIVIDDKSTKDVDEYLAVKKDKTFSHVAFLDNDTGKKGAGASRNVGLQHAKGEWLLFADADDLFEKDFYEIVKKYFLSSCDVVFFFFERGERYTRRLAEQYELTRAVMEEYHKSPTLKNELRLRYKYIPPWSKLIRHEMVKTHEMCYMWDDVAFSAQVGFHMQSFHVSTEKIYFTTLSVGSLSKTLSEERYDTMLEEGIWRYNYLKQRLERKDFGYLGLCGAVHLADVFRYGFGLKKFLKVLRILRENKVSILSPRYLNPVYFFGGLKNKHAERVYNREFEVRG